MPIEYSIVTGYFYKNGKRVGAKHGKGYTVIWWENKCWQAYIKSKGKKMNLGCYDTAEEASVAYQAAKARLHTHAPGWRFDKTEPDQ